MKGDDPASRTEIRNDVPLLRARKTGEEYGIGRKAVKPCVLYDFSIFNEHILQHFVFTKLHTPPS